MSHVHQSVQTTQGRLLTRDSRVGNEHLPGERQESLRLKPQMIKQMEQMYPNLFKSSSRILNHGLVGRNQRLPNSAYRS